MDTELKHIIDEDGTQYLCGFDGTQYWFLNDLLHREDGPAVIHTNGIQHWLLDGVLHRTDGPAVIWPDGTEYWYLNNVLYDFTDWLKVLDVNEKTKTLLALKWSSR